MTLGVQEPWDSEFDLTGLPTTNWFPKKKPQFSCGFSTNKGQGFRCPILFVGGIGSLLITWDFGWGLGRVGGCKNDISTLHHFVWRALKINNTTNGGFECQPR